jgi:hypothetical protein
MSRSERWVYLAPVVEEFRASLTPDEQEEFNEMLVRAYLDPFGRRTGADRRMRPPLVYYALAGPRFGILYLTYKIVRGERERIEVFQAGFVEQPNQER